MAFDVITWLKGFGPLAGGAGGFGAGFSATTSFFTFFLKMDLIPSLPPETGMIMQPANSKIYSFLIQKNNVKFESHKDTDFLLS